MNGKRASGGQPFPDWKAGDYGRFIAGDGKDQGWYAVTPNGHVANLTRHDVEEHADGTVTVSPSILVSKAGGQAVYHGWLKRGVWSDA